MHQRKEKKANETRRFSSDALDYQAPLHLKDLILVCYPNRALRSQTAGLLAVSKSRMGSREFSDLEPPPSGGPVVESFSHVKIGLKSFLPHKIHR